MAIKDKFKNVSKKMKELSKEKVDGIKEQVMEEPFAIIDVKIVVGIIQDPVNVIGEMLQDPEFIGDCIKMALDCVPYVGPLLSGIFSMFWPEDPMKKPVTKEELEKRLTELKTEMEKIMDEKIEKSQSELWKGLVKAFFDTLAYRCDDLKDNLSVLKRQLKETGDGTDEIKNDIRVALNEIRHQTKQLSNFCRNDNYVRYTVGYYLDCLFIMSTIYRQMDAYWYQFGIDPLLVSGAPKEPGLDEIRSIRQKFHDNLFEGINHLTKGVIENISKSQTDLNKDFMSKAKNLLKLDTYLYPCKVITAPLDGDGSFNIPDIKGNFIYRVDGAAFKGGVKVKEADPLTGCRGVTTRPDKPSISIKLSKKRSVQIRILGQYHTYVDFIQMEMDGVEIPDEKKGEVLVGLSGMGGLCILPTRTPCYDLESVQFPLTLIKSDEVKEFGKQSYVKSGYTQTKKLLNVDHLNLTFSVRPPKSEPVSSDNYYENRNIMYIDDSQGHIKFIEFIISN